MRRDIYAIAVSNWTRCTMSFALVVPFCAVLILLIIVNLPNQTVLQAPFHHDDTLVSKTRNNFKRLSMISDELEEMVNMLNRADRRLSNYVESNANQTSDVIGKIETHIQNLYAHVMECRRPTALRSGKRSCGVGDESDILWDMATNKISATNCSLSDRGHRVRIKGSITILGDSLMMRTFNVLRLLVKSTSKREIKSAQRCNRHKYLDVSGPMLTAQESEEKVGPLLFGKTHPGCTDCSGCNSIRIELDDDFFIEYIAMEFTKDTEIYNGRDVLTTQRAIQRYLQRPANTPDYLLISSGTHEECMTSDDMEGQMTELLTMMPSKKQTLFVIPPFTRKTDRTNGCMKIKHASQKKVCERLGVPFIDGSILSRTALSVPPSVSAASFDDEVHPKTSYFGLTLMLFFDYIK